MGFRLRPMESVFFDMFAQLGDQLVVGGELLAEMMSAGADRAEIAERMRTAEHSADEVTHAIVSKVNSTFITPMDREDLYALAVGLDDVMDAMDEAIDLILLYNVKELPAELPVMVDIIQRCAEVTRDALPRLKSPRQLTDYWVEINRLENEGDRTNRRILAALFNGDVKTIEVLKLKDIVAALEEAVDSFERAANIVEQIAVKGS